MDSSIIICIPLFIPDNFFFLFFLFKLWKYDNTFTGDLEKYRMKLYIVLPYNYF